MFEVEALGWCRAWGLGFGVQMKSRKARDKKGFGEFGVLKGA